MSIRKQLTAPSNNSSAAKRLTGLTAMTALLVGGLMALTANPANAYGWSRTVGPGATGADVREVQVRVTGWVNSTSNSRRTAQLDGSFGTITSEAVKNFQRIYGLTADGVVGPVTQSKLNTLEAAEGTASFDYSEFDDNGCQCFSDSRATTVSTRENIRRLMYRLEVLRKKQGSNAIVVTSGFRTKTRNAQINGAANSQHTYGTAADHQIRNVANRTGRDSARASAFSAIFCYANSRHNHADIRANNPDDGISDTSTQDPWRNSSDQDTSNGSTPCFGEGGSSSASLDLVGDAVMDDGVLLYLDPDEDTGFTQSP